MNIKNDKVFICEIDGKKYYLGPEADEKMAQIRPAMALHQLRRIEA